MHFLLAVHGSAHPGPLGPYASEEQMHQAFADTGRFNESLQAEGHWVFAGGLLPPASATLVDATGPEPTTRPGAYLSGEECLSGFWIIEAEDEPTAVRLATEASAACRSQVEVRPLAG